MPLHPSGSASWNRSRITTNAASNPSRTIPSILPSVGRNAATSWPTLSRRTSPIYATAAGLSQAELADAIGGDGRQHRRYENDRITPSLDALARIAQHFDTSLDHLVFDNIPRRPLHSTTNAIDGRLHHITELDENDQQALLNHLDALLTRTRLHAITNTSGT